MVIGNWKWLSSFFPNYLKYSGLGLLATIGAISAVFANCIGSVDGFLFPSVISNPAAVHVRRVVNFPRAITVNKAEKNSVEKQMFAASFWLLDIGYWLLVISYQRLVMHAAESSLTT